MKIHPHWRTKNTHTRIHSTIFKYVLHFYVKYPMTHRLMHITHVMHIRKTRLVIIIIMEKKKRSLLIL